MSQTSARALSSPHSTAFAREPFETTTRPRSCSEKHNSEQRFLWLRTGEAGALPQLHLKRSSNRQRSSLCQTVWTGCCNEPLVGRADAACHFHRGATAHAATPSCLPPPRNSWEWSIPSGARRSRFADVMGSQASMHEQLLHRSRSHRDGKFSFSKQSLLGAEHVAVS